MFNQLLKWIVNKNETALHLVDFDEDEIFQFLLLHRMEGRLLKRITEGSRPNWYTDSLEMKITERMNTIRETNKKRMEFIQEISAGLKDSPLIVIKGFTTYALTNNSENIRYSGDVDVFYIDLIHLKEDLLRRGFRDDGKGSKHEFAKLENDNIYLELHNSFPVISVPEDLKKEISYKNLTTQSNGSTLSFAQIMYEDILNNGMYGITPDTNNIFFPDYEMSTLLLCAHMFKDNIWEPYRYPAIRFAELVEIQELSHHANFNKGKFNNLVEQFKARDAVQFASRLLDCFFNNQNNLKTDNGTESKMIFHKIMNGEVGPWFISNNEKFYENLPSRNIESIVSELGSVEVIANGLEYSTEDLMPVYKWSENDLFLDFKFSVLSDNCSVFLKVSVNDKLTNNDNVLIHFGGKKFIHLWLNTDLVNNRVFGDGEYSISTFENRYEITFHLKEQEIHQMKNQSVKAILALTKTDGNDRINTLVPLSISMEKL